MTTPTPSTSDLSSIIEPPAFQAALETLERELRRLDPEALLAVNLDVPTIALLALGAATRIRDHRAEMIEWFGAEMVASADRLELVARAAGQAHLRWRGSTSTVDIPRLSAGVVALRAQFITDFQGLIHRNLFPAEILETLRGIKAYRDQCFDLLQLVSILRDDWARIDHATVLEIADLDRAEACANELAVALANRGRSHAPAAADLRQRAFTLLVTTYDDVRRMVTFLRWKHGDVEEIAPSLYAGRRGRKRRGVEDTALDEAGRDVADASETVVAPHIPRPRSSVDS